MAVAEFERGIIRERVNAGIEGSASVAHRPLAEVGKLKAQGLGIRSIARRLKMPPSSVYKALQLLA